MARYFVPYAEDHPAAIEVKGHRLLLVGVKESDVFDQLDAVGADAVHEFVAQSDEERQSALSALAHSIQGGVVLTPAGISFSTMLKNLEQELPWIH